jgi:hypothetical protein
MEWVKERKKKGEELRNERNYSSLSSSDFLHKGTYQKGVSTKLFTGS